MSVKRVLRNGRVYVTSSRSNTNNTCVGVAVGIITGVIDTKNPEADGIDFGSAAWTGFLDATKSGRFNLS